MLENHKQPGTNPSASTGEQTHGSVKKKYVFFIDKEKEETDKPVLKVREILTDFAKVDVSKNILAIKENGSFRDLTNLEETIELKEGMHFTVLNQEPTPVS